MTTNYLLSNEILAAIMMYQINTSFENADLIFNLLSKLSEDIP